MAGHSKWKQIKHKKAVTDAKKSQLFSKVAREIMVAARAGGTSAETNIRLRTALERARGVGLPKDNIERAIERAAGAGDDAKLQEFLYEASAPGGVLILIEGITDSINRSIAEIKHILSGHGAKLAGPGSVAWNFDKIGILVISAEANPRKTGDDLELLIIDAGASDARREEATFFVETEYTRRDAVRSRLEGAGVVVGEIGHDYKPKNTVELEEKLRGSMNSLLDDLLAHDDVQEVYTNLASG